MPQLAIDAGYAYLLHGLLLAACAYLISTLPPRATSSRHWLLAQLLSVGVLAFFTFVVSEPPRVLEDFRTAYFRAGQAVSIGPAELIAELQRGVDGFVNLPVAAYLFAPLAMLPSRGADIVFTALGLLAILVAWYGLCVCFDLQRRERMLLLLLFAACGPLHNSVKEGNTSHIVLLLLVGALLSLRHRREFLAGALLGFAAIIKLPLLLFGAYAILRRQWQLLAGGATVCVAVVLSSLLVFGWSAHLTWYEEVLAPYSTGQVLAFNVQSVRAFLGRMIFDSTVLTNWSPVELSSTVRVLSTVLCLTLLAIFTAVVLRPAIHPHSSNLLQTRTAIEFSLVLVLSCVLSPLSWSHYYCWLLVPAALFLAARERLTLARSSARLGLVGVVLTLPPILMPPASFGEKGWYVHFGVSYLFLAACMMTFALMLARVSLSSRIPSDVAFAGGAVPDRHVT